jgi:riboflavin synthase alpha subunit
LNVQDELLPAASVAVRVTVVVPAPDNTVPAAGLCTTVIAPTAEQLSLNVAAVNAGSVRLQDAFSGSVTFAGHVMTGGVWSVGITWNVQVVLLPASSVAVRVTVVVPVITVPTAGDCVTVTEASQLSVDVASPV